MPVYIIWVFLIAGNGGPAQFHYADKESCETVRSQPALKYQNKTECFPVKVPSNKLM